MVAEEMVDTNIVLRYILDDVPDQSQRCLSHVIRSAPRDLHLLNSRRYFSLATRVRSFIM